jgi:hypothetical protein
MEPPSLSVVDAVLRGSFNMSSKLRFDLGGFGQDDEPLDAGGSGRRVLDDDDSAATAAAAAPASNHSAAATPPHDSLATPRPPASDEHIAHAAARLAAADMLRFGYAAASTPGLSNEDRRRLADHLSHE